MSEETVNADKNAAWGVIIAVGMSFIVGLLLILGMTFSIQVSMLLYACPAHVHALPHHMQRQAWQPRLCMRCVGSKHAADGRRQRLCG